MDCVRTSAYVELWLQIVGYPACWILVKYVAPDFYFEKSMNPFSTVLIPLEVVLDLWLATQRMWACLFPLPKTLQYGHEMTQSYDLAKKLSGNPVGPEKVACLH